METPKTSSDEIDLESVMLKLVLSLRQNFILILTFFILGTVLGYFYSIKGTKIYSSKMMITSEFLRDSYTDKLNKNLNDIIADGNDELLASKLNLSMEDVTLISGIKIEGVQKEKTSASLELYYLFITADVLDPEVFPKLEKGLVYFFNNNEFAKVRAEQTVNYYTQLISKIDGEIQSLEDFKKKVYEGNFFEKNKNNVMFDPTSINSKIVGLTQEKLTFQKDLALRSSVQVVEGFTKFKNPAKPNKIISLMAGSILGLFIVGIIILFKTARRILRYADKAQLK